MKKTFWIIKIMWAFDKAVLHSNPRQCTLFKKFRTSVGAELKVARLEAGFAFSSGGIVLMHRPPEETE